MTAPAAVGFMAPLVTRPYQRGAEIITVPVGADVAGWTTIAPYGFTDYTARYGVIPPTPAYVLCATADGPFDATEMVVEHTTAGPPATVTVPLPPRVLAGATFAIPLPATATSSTRLTRFQQRPVSGPGPGATRWKILALLGNTAKLLWVIGWEKDALRAFSTDVRRQRNRADARGYSLDLLGRDLRVPRFPPAEHSFDADVLALYHLNDDVVNGGVVADEMKKFGAPGHDGVNNGARSGTAGKFGAGFRFPGVGGASASITVPHHADFNVASNAGFTVEAFILSDAADAPDPRIVIMKRTTEAVTPATTAGWAISLGTFRGVRNNVMCSFADGTVEVKLFADLDVADGLFHHLAAVLDRANVRARLYVDGVQVASAPLDGLGGGATTMGAIANAQPIRIGRSTLAAQQYAGIIDEIRLSRVTRTEFNPVLGESDERYRRRLGIFESWLLPTYDTLLATINGLVRINGQSDSFILIEENRASASASSVVRILPGSLPGEQSIDADGRLGVTEAFAAGVPAEDTTFSELFLLRHDDPAVTYASEQARRMQAATLDVLDELIAALLAVAPGDPVFVDSSYDPASTTLHRVGRALRLRHATLSAEQLAIAAHRAGFDYVLNDTAAVEVATAPGEKLAVIIEPRTPANTPPPDLDVIVGRSVELHLAPEPLPSGGIYAWSLVPCGPGRAHFERHSADAATLRTPITTRPHLSVVADAPGTVTVRAEYAYRGQTVFGTLTLRVGIETLGVGETIAANGALEVTEDAAVGKPGEVVNPIYLITHNAPGVSYGVNPANRRMQVVLERALDRMLGLLAGTGGTLTILKAYDPGGPQLHAAARALRFRHNVVPAAELAAVAFRAGFGFVTRTTNQVYASVAQGERIGIATMPGLAPLGDELVVGTTVRLRARLEPLPPAGTYNWSVDAIASAGGTFDTVVRAETRFTPRAPGLISLNASYIENDPTRALPYTFAIRLKPSLDVPTTVIPKYEYDLIMNILNYFHPIGVEVDTSNIREHVVEVQANLLNAFPGYTYPDFRG